MAWDACTGNEPRSIGAAVRHGRFGSACAAAMVTVALAAAICAIVLMLGADGAAAAPRSMAVDGQGPAYAMAGAALLVFFTLVGAAYRLTPSHVRRRRNRR